MKHGLELPPEGPRFHKLAVKRLCLKVKGRWLKFSDDDDDTECEESRKQQHLARRRKSAPKPHPLN
eukprot:3572405-Pleurochrysis_carterae.AAC.1